MAYSFSYLDLNTITDKYGDTCKLTKENIKDIYFLTDCNTNSGGDIAVNKYLEEHYSPKDILEWNDEHINNLLDGCVTESEKWEQIAETGYKLQIASNIYTDNRCTYKKIIDMLKSFYKTYGYFVNYYFLKKTPSYPYEDKSFDCFSGIYISKNADLAPYGFGDERRYLTDDGFCGFIPRLHKLKYTDLLNELLTELFLPVLIHFEDFLNDTVTDVMKKLGVIYIQAGISDICEYPVRNLFKRYVQDNAIILPAAFKNVLSDFPLTEENAREYYFRCRCSLNKIYNRKDDNAKKFISYNIGRQTLDGWTNEWISDRISLNEAENVITENLLFIVRNFSDIVNVGNAKKMINIYNGIKSGIKNSIKRAIIYDIEINRITNVTRCYGLLYIAAKNGLCDCIEGLESEFFALLNGADVEIIKNSIIAMYKNFGIKN